MADISLPSLSKDRALALAAAIGGAVTLWRLIQLFAAPINLSFDEAQYWGWAQDPAFGYFSKPPFIAWAIALTTAIGGDGEPWVRVSATLSHFATALSLFVLGRRLFDNTVGLWSAALWITLPAVAVSAMIASTDAYLLLFWSLGLLSLHRAQETDGAKDWTLLGLWIGLGLLSKYAMMFFLVSMALFLLSSAEHRRLLRRPGPWAAVALGCLIHGPNLYWNWSHGMASYRHIGANANLKGALFNPSELAEFLGGQLGVFGPVPFATLAAILLARLRRALRNPNRRFLILFCAPTLLAISAQALLSRANANWAAAAYPSATVLVAAWLADWTVWGRRALAATVALHVVVAVALYNADELSRLVGQRPPYDLRKRLRGWDDAGVWARETMRAHGDLTPLFADRKTMATLLYYARPDSWRGVMWAPGGHVGDHYQLTVPLAPAPGGDYLLIARGEDNRAAAAFKSVDALSTFRRPIGDGYVLTLRAYRLCGFKGYAQ